MTSETFDCSSKTYYSSYENTQTSDERSPRTSPGLEWCFNATGASLRGRPRFITTTSRAKVWPYKLGHDGGSINLVHIQVILR
jgi:hypothetical protein